MTVMNRKILPLATLPSGFSAGTTEKMPEKVIQFGDGRFLRGFVDWLIDEANSKGLFRGSVVIVKNRAAGDSIEQLNRQDGLFTVMIRGIDGGETVERAKIITSVNRGINPYHQWPEYLACAENADLRFAVSNTTEAGLLYKPESVGDGPKNTFPANLTAFLYHRFNHFQGDPSRGLIMLPTELIEDNGAALRSAVFNHARDWQLPAAFCLWLDNHNYFLNTLVDRIVTACSEELKLELGKRLGYEDSQVVCGEPYHLWAIEGPAHLQDEFPLYKAGLNVYWQDDITPFRVRKLRILNGSHTLLAAIALLLGQKTVRESLADETVNNLLTQMIYQEIIPTLDLPTDDITAFAEAVTGRLKNPFINHYWEDILTNSTVKFTARVLPTLKGYIHKYNTLPNGIVLSLASLLLLYQTTIHEEQEVCHFFAALWRDSDSFLALVQAALANTNLWKEDLSAIAGLAECVAESMEKIQRDGIRTVLAEKSA